MKSTKVKFEFRIKIVFFSSGVYIARDRQYQTHKHLILFINIDLLDKVYQQLFEFLSRKILNIVAPVE